MIQNQLFRRAFRIQCGLLLLFKMVVVAEAQTNSSPVAVENRFEKKIEAYEAADRTNPPPLGAILLVGDSQFFRWKTLAGC